MTVAEKWTAAEMPDLTGKVAIVTGGNSGIGLEAVRELARKGAQVILAARSEEKGRKAVDTLHQEMPTAQVELRLLDLADLGAVRAFAATVLRDFTRLDLLINNAGVMAIPERKTVDGLEMQLGTNHFGHFALTGLLLEPLLAAPAARIVTVSSGAHKMGKMDFDNLNWEQGGYQKWQAYGRSKLANLLFAFELQRRLARAGAKAISVAAHPGYTSTNLQYVGPQMEGSSWMESMMKGINSLVAQPGEMGALPTLYAAVAPDVQGGDYIGPDGLFEMRGYPQKVEANAAAHNEADAAQLWARSEVLTGVGYPALETVRV
jgi:NAD(P)-dependent dehydrogenase (short-subunit alcohol dehydrogenase family)